MKTWKLINNIFIGEEDNISGIPKKGDIIKIGEDFSYKYKTPFLQSSKKESIIESIKPLQFSIQENFNNIENNINNNIHSVEDLSEFEMLEILYNKALENEG